MRSTDPLITYQLATSVAELGSAFHISVSRSPADGSSNDKQIGKVRALRVHLQYKTEGRGDTDQRKLSEVEIPLDRFGAGGADATLHIPFSAPISYDGSLIRVRYQVVVTTDLQHAIDDRTEIDVIVAPQGGAQTYRRPHPLSL